MLCAARRGTGVLTRPSADPFAVPDWPKQAVQHFA
jgi:hypothetical protein